MSDLKAETRELPSSEEKASPFVQAGPLTDLSLLQLRDQIKKIMIPLLIKTFQLKQELSQSISSPSRLQSKKHTRSEEEITEQLQKLDDDLKVLLLWCQSCQSQVQKALAVLEEEQKPVASASPDATAHPGASKSFSEIVSAAAPLLKEETEQRDELAPAGIESLPVATKWWQRWKKK